MGNIADVPHDYQLQLPGVLEHYYYTLTLYGISFCCLGSLGGPKLGVVVFEYPGLIIIIKRGFGGRREGRCEGERE